MAYDLFIDSVYCCYFFSNSFCCFAAFAPCLCFAVLCATAILPPPLFVFALIHYVVPLSARFASLLSHRYYLTFCRFLSWLALVRRLWHLVPMTYKHCLTNYYLDAFLSRDNH